MFNITPSEVIIIVILALIVLGPERLPDMARSLGQTVNKLKKLAAGLQETVNDISDDPSMKPIKDLGELATRPRQKLAQFAAEAEAEERADRIARERADLEEQQNRLALEGQEQQENPEHDNDSEHEEDPVPSPPEPANGAVTDTE